MAKTNNKLHNQTKKQKFSCKQEELFKIILIDNATYTPMEVIDQALRKVFGKDYQQAQFTMLALSQYGYAVCGVYPKAAAKEKVNEFKSLIKQHQLALKCEMEHI